MTVNDTLPAAQNTVFTEIDIGQAHRIKHLWQRLNELHQDNSMYHKNHFASFTFEDRMSDLAGRDKLKIFCAFREENLFAYCLASIDGDEGEIDSLFVEKNSRISGVGSKLMEMAEVWFEAENITKITVSVAHGNEKALPFYNKHGFYERMILLTREK